MKKKDLHKKDAGFKVPESYFGNFEGRLFEKIRMKNTLPVDDGFSVPKAYFKSFENRLFQKLHQEKTSKVIRLNTYKKIYYTLASVAALFLLFLAVDSILFPKDKLGIDIIDIVVIENYISEGYMALNSDDLAEVFEEETLELTSIAEEGIDDEKLVDYLYENLDDYNDLMIEN